ncbi:MAG: Rossmann-like and DUF2520 domain-containing protein [Bacteroidales bacterium]|jgi:predicted short-subunit dehydrogenase-like oxidoreductase (DUF2520 family)
MYQKNISFAGAGRVSEALCKELFRAGFTIDRIVSETETRGRSLADFCNALWSADLFFPDSTEVLIVAVPDHRLKSVLDKLECAPGTLVVHTAGSFGLDVFPEHIKHKGIFYPLQTFSKSRKISFPDLPFLLESSDVESSVILKNLVESIGGKVHFVDTEQRRILHVSAVFACNFTNHMLTLGKDVALKAGFQFDILAPLIKETFSKAMDSGPENSQTGPAVRHDQNTIEKHLELLSFSPELQKIYNEVTQSIIEYYKKKDNS